MEIYVMGGNLPRTQIRQNMAKAGNRIEPIHSCRRVITKIKTTIPVED